MSARPILVLQLRRLGDLILTFPLLLQLGRQFPKNPLWVCAEPDFFKELMPFAPEAVFFPPAHLPALAREAYLAIANLSIRADAARCAGSARTELQLGPAAGPGGLRVAGFWQLYRAALTRNNRHNTLHWADLNRLDFVAAPPAPALFRPGPRPAGHGRIGLFVGASEPGKRPEAMFWSGLARRLARLGFRPVILGGKAERDIGARIAAHSGLGHANFCGRLSLGELAAMLKSLDLCVTPDTGPMHLADWLGVPVLNLSMGNVNAWETGPASPGQHVLRAKMSCYGCWQCFRPRQYCKLKFNPVAVAAIALALMAGKDAAAEAGAAGLELLVSGRDSLGLAVLEATARPSARTLLDGFWRAAWLSFAWPGHGAGLEKSALALCQNAPAVALSLLKSLDAMAAAFLACRKGGMPLPDDFWKSQPWHSRLFAGHAQMALQNADYSPNALVASLERVAALKAVFAAFS